VTIPVLAPAPGEGPGSAPPPPPPIDAPTGRDPARTRIALIVGAGGLVLAGGGLALGVSASSTWNDAFDSGACDRASNTCSPAGQALTDKARTRAMLSTVLIGGGLAAVGVGVVLYLTAPTERGGVAWVPTVTSDSVGIAWNGAL
jgi:hypothetical protein